MSLKDIRKNLEGPSEDSRYEAWLNLYRSRAEECVAEIENILSGSDATLKIIFARFLARLDEERAAFQLVGLIQDLNPVVSDAAIRSFEKSRFKNKFKALLPLLGSPMPKIRRYAMGWLAQNRVSEAIPMLVGALAALKGREDPDSMELLNALLTAFRFLPDRRALSLIRPYLKDARELIRFKASLALGSLYESGDRATRKDLLDALSDPAPQIRKGVLWSLRRKPSWRNLRFLMERAKADPDAEVRQEAIEGLGHYRRARVIGHLLAILVEEKERYVALKAESVLLSFPVPALSRGLKEALLGEEPKRRAKAMALLADLHAGSKKHLRYLLSGLKSAGPDKEKIPYIEALGALRNLNAIPALERQALSPSPVLSYAAMGSMLKIWKAHGHFPVLKYLTDPSVAVLSKQMILKNLLPKSQHWKWDERLIAALRGMVGDENLNIRYLAVQCLVSANRESLVGLLVGLALTEQDPSFLKSIRLTLRDLLRERPDLILSALEEHRQSVEAVLFLLNMLREAGLAGERAEEVALFAINMAGRHPEDKIRDALADLLADLVRRGGLDLPRLFSLMGRSKDKEELLVAMNKKIKGRFLAPAQLPAATLKAWFKDASPGLIHALIDLLAASLSREAIPMLVSFLCDDRQRAYHYQASQALKQLLQEDQTQ